MTGSWTSTQPLTVTEDPRVTKDGVTDADLREQFEHNMRVRDLVSEANKLVVRVRAAQASLRDSAGGAGDKLSKLNELASHLITPSIRYSKPDTRPIMSHVAQAMLAKYGSLTSGGSGTVRLMRA